MNGWEFGLQPGSGWQVIEKLWNRITQYPVSSELREKYKHELQTWMDNSWWPPYINEEFDPPKGLIMLMAVLQTYKHPVCPVIDYHELKPYVDTITGPADVCTELWGVPVNRPSSSAMIDGKAQHAWNFEPARHRHITLQWSPLFDPDQFWPHVVFDLAAASSARCRRHYPAIGVCVFQTWYPSGALGQ